VTLLGTKSVKASALRLGAPVMVRGTTAAAPAGWSSSMGSVLSITGVMVTHGATTDYGFSGAPIFFSGPLVSETPLVVALHQGRTSDKANRGTLFHPIALWWDRKVKNAPAKVQDDRGFPQKAEEDSFDYFKSFLVAHEAEIEKFIKSGHVGRDVDNGDYIIYINGKSLYMSADEYEAFIDGGADHVVDDHDDPTIDDAMVVMEHKGDEFDETAKLTRKEKRKQKLAGAESAPAPKVVTKGKSDPVAKAKAKEKSKPKVKAGKVQKSVKKGDPTVEAAKSEEKSSAPTEVTLEDVARLLKSDFLLDLLKAQQVSSQERGSKK